MDIILHPGAHRTASTSFQYYMRQNAAPLRARGTAFWGPAEMRAGLLTGVVPRPGLVPASEQLRRARGRVALQMAKLRDAGAERLIISDENLIGSPLRNIRDMRLYPAIGERMARYRNALGGRIDRVVFSIRAQDAYWASALAFSIPRHGAIPGAVALDHMANSPRSWKGVITDLACALPDAQITVLLHESFASVPERKLTIMCGLAKPPQCHAREWLNRSPDLDTLRGHLAERGQDPDQLRHAGDGGWHPFTKEQRRTLRHRYSDDLDWLRAGADGLAQLTENPAGADTVKTPAAAGSRRGQTDDIEQRRLA
ncbi:hypothetical protein [Roseovarius pelagicus]|uniref:Uncharacterized protein n=1 Tax=Roseovarius pelagicus TaxID=2980108 RepID=A0ABY6DD65_9RHOB|nr:hypothetical protein [Roseovarius pelagicus]UXX84082.1 hypothetical protein N7U68_05360 [Roseovarius pelagicus]